MSTNLSTVRLECVKGHGGEGPSAMEGLPCPRPHCRRPMRVQRPLDGYHRCLSCCLHHHDRCDGNAYIWHVGSDTPEVVPCECAECKAPEPNDIAPPLSWDPEEDQWAPTQR